MYYKNKTSDQEYNIQSLREAFPNITFSDEPDQEILDHIGFDAYPDKPLIEPTESFLLESAKFKKNLEINEQRMLANFTTFSFQGKEIACDALSRSDIDATNGLITLLSAMPKGWVGAWKAVDNTYITLLTISDWKAFYAAMFLAGNENFAHAQILKTTLNTALTVEEVEAIQW